MSTLRTMWRTKRTAPEPRMEMLPLIDVIFLMLTFFIYALVLMVPIELLPVPLQAFASGKAATPAPLVTVTIALDGRLFVNREPVEMEAIPDRLTEAVANDSRTVLAIALADGEGEVDRAPILTELWDNLEGLGLEINLVGRPKNLTPAIENAPIPQG
jgi:biopolymer transport protein ExbD